MDAVVGRRDVWRRDVGRSDVESETAGANAIFVGEGFACAGGKDEADVTNVVGTAAMGRLEVLEISGWLRKGTALEVIAGGNVVLVGDGELVFVVNDGGNVVVVGDGESVVVTAGGGKVVFVGDGVSVFTSLKAVVVGDGVDAALPGVSGEDSGLSTRPAASLRTTIRKASTMDCPRRLPRLEELSILESSEYA